MKSLQKNKTLLIAIAVFLVAIFVYQYFFKPSQDALNQSTITEGVGNDVVALYNSLQSATLDQSLFSTQTYRGLVDFSTTIAPQPTGGANPFDIIGK